MGLTQDEALARAAGIYIGEGGAYYHAAGHWFQLRVTQCNSRYEPEGIPTALTFFREAVGLGEIYGPYQKGGRRLVWEYRAGREEAVRVFEMLRQYLSVEKQCQGDAALEGWAKFTATRRHRWGTDEEYGCGHLRTPENTNWWGDHANCRECHRLRSERRNRRIAAEKRAKSVAEPT